MGVFARLLGKKPKVMEEPEAEAPAGTEPDGSEAENAAEQAAEATAAKGPGEDDGGSADTEPDMEPDTEPETGAAVVAAESTEIPKQQSAREAADNEAGEGART
ncbi:hypothetical protein EDD90_3120 [Streptomyces sp. Ag109_O5-1]|uniref:hypothetical protein n=1 Tax=Streptomyces sp. Ag109_O5-1 TaxID=1938851 RepID=UPI000F4DA423|nr:hypothetical protein [Streptomyces sp. Ag109_O5-1]RPE40091.1 hypothetical protein EDD90_3120 [Streptomyces sp. Ag109_O5-1]